MHLLQVEILAKQILKAPVEIQVGGRSVVNKDITQYVEIRQPEDRFMRLLELLGEWTEQGKVLVFVNSQEQCDKLFRDLLQVPPPPACMAIPPTLSCALKPVCGTEVLVAVDEHVYNAQSGRPCCHRLPQLKAGNACFGRGCEPGTSCVHHCVRSHA